MPTRYEMRLTAEHIDTFRLDRIDEACLKEWNFDKMTLIVVTNNGYQILTGRGIGWLADGETEESFTDRLAESIWKANGGSCRVKIDALNLDDRPAVHHSRDGSDYARSQRTFDN